jgi:hypothetical protein
MFVHLGNRSSAVPHRRPIPIFSAHDHVLHLVPVLLNVFLHAGPRQFPALTEPPTTVSHDSTYLPPLSAPGPAEAGGVMPEPGSPGPGASVQAGPFTLPKVSKANGPAGSVSAAPLVGKPLRILPVLVSCLAFYLHL